MKLTLIISLLSTDCDVKLLTLVRLKKKKQKESTLEISLKELENLFMILDSDSNWE